METKKDALGREIKVGEMVAYGTSSNYPTPKIGKVVGFTPKKVKVAELFTFASDKCFHWYESVINKDASNLIQIPKIDVPIINGNEEVKWEDIV